MSPEDFSGVDIDLLADYVGGALDGDDEATVARLIADDPAWRAAWEAIAPGMATVQASLRALDTEPMPADVVARLDAALGSPIADVTPIDAALLTPSGPRLEPVRGERHRTAVPEHDDRPVAVPAKRRRRLRWAAPIAVAAGVLAFAGIGIEYLSTSTQTTADSSAAGSAENAAPMVASDAAGSALVTGLADDQILASGTDYRGGTLADRPDRAKEPAESGEARKSTSLGSAPELQRLRARAALMACLEAIAQENGAGPITVETVDYARFNGAAALVVRFSAGGLTWSWATGPECGTSPAGADRKGSVRVG